jgi:hypothetical protein
MFLPMSAYPRKARGIRKSATDGQDINQGSIDSWHPETTIEILKRAPSAADKKRYVYCATAQESAKSLYKIENCANLTTKLE